ncbi:MAG TPA: hypothetical protein VK467_04510, partial [Gemmatimonadales bacterium]|nr:hypothetical protein [Gemmatimonadales bacterium]
GDILSRMQDVSINVPGIQNAQVTGGLRPSAMGDVARTSNALLAKQALMKQLEGDSFSGGNLLQAPQQSAMPQGNALDSLLQYGGMAGSMAGAVMGAQTPGQTINLPDAPAAENSSYVPKPTGADTEELQRLIALLGQQQGGFE